MEETTYELVTKLCEIHINQGKSRPESTKAQQIVKELRIKAFEILLNKKSVSGPSVELKGNTNPICHLFVWHFNLKNDPNQSGKAPIVKSLIDRIKSSNILNDSTTRSMLMFLMYLKESIPYQDDQNQKYNMFNLDTLKLNSNEKNVKAAFDIFPGSKFILPNILRLYTKSSKTYPLKMCSSQPKFSISLIEEIKINNERDVIESFPTKFNFRLTARQKFKTVRFAKDLVEELIEDENYSPVIESRQSIWQLVVNMPVTNYRTWDYLGYPEPTKELPFATESKPKTLRYFQNLVDYYSVTEFAGENELSILTTLVSHEMFVKNLKNMLVGITSEIFLADIKDIIYLKAGVSLESISEKNLQSYCTDLLQCGSCYRALNRICFTYSSSSNEKFGFIFKELCFGVTRYLKYYRAVVLSLPDSTSLLKLHNYIRCLKRHIIVLARLCKVELFSNNNETDYRCGVDLLNYMYQEILKTNDKDVSGVLYSIFYPCCQSYFSRFLQRWLFEGILMDPYEEFFVKSELNYLNSRSRIYWTRGFSVKQHNVPEFLIEIRHDILQCGKYMNLLKLCKPNASLFASTLSRTLPLMTSCLTPAQLNRLRQDIERYYAEMTAICGPFILLEHELRERCDQNLEFLDLVEKIRALHFKRIELKKQEEIEEKAKHKRKIFEEMKEQMRISVEQKQKAKEDELKNDILIQEEHDKMEQIKLKRLEEESKHLIKYYDHLIEAVDKRRENIEKQKQQLQDEPIVREIIPEESITTEVAGDITGIMPKHSNTAENSQTILRILEKSKTDLNTETNINSEQNMKNLLCNETASNENQNESLEIDKENANIKVSTNLSTEVKINNDINETFLAARRNKAKILNLEFGVAANKKLKQIVPKVDTSNMTEAQRNKIRVLSSEFDIFNGNEYTRNKAIQMENNVNINAIVVKQTSSTFPKFTENLASPGHENVMNIIHRKTIIQNELPTISETDAKEFIKEIEKKINYESAKRPCDINIPLAHNEIIPMSIDSTPITELPTPSSMKLSLCTDNMFNSPHTLDSALLTTTSNMTDDGFKFPYYEPKKYVYENAIQLLYADKNKNTISAEKPLELNRRMKFTKEEIQQINNNNIKLMLHQSVILPLEAQAKLVNNEILSYFIHDQKFFSHLHSLRCYYFLLDGEFGRRITEGLFNKLYEVGKPADLLNCRSLQAIIDKAIYASSKTHENAERLSFIIQDIPNKFDLSNAEVLECLSLSYRVHWPVNILLPTDTIEKYNNVFKYLLKLHHMSWILQKMFQELKFVRKTEAVDYNILMLSPQYHQIQLHRYIMTHFVQTLQNYTVSQVLQTSWAELENNIKTVATLDQLYTVHIIYVKTIMFRCLLNKKCSPIRKVILEIFAIILKFYNCLRSSRWILKPNDEYFTHPNFKKLQDIFHKFEEFANFIFRVGSKMARVGYQPHLIQMLDMLNMNSYYANKQNV